MKGIQHKTFHNVAGLVSAIIICALVFTWLNLKFQSKKTVTSLPVPHEELWDEADTRALPEVAAPESLRVPILMYHHIGTPPPKASAVRKGLTLSPELFEQEVQWLHEQGFVSVSLEQVYLASQGKFVLPKKPVVFTFDDGYDDVFTLALPVLEKFGYKGSFAIITQYPQNQKQGDNFYASWEEIKKASENGHEIVSHTQNHFLGKDKKYTADYIYANLSGSRKDIEDHLGKTTRILIYPYGSYTPEYIEQAKKAGFVMGLTVHFGDTIDTKNLMQVPRLRVNGGEDFAKFKKMFGPFLK